MKPLLSLVIALLASKTLALAQSVATDPVGFIPLTIRGNSDTHLSLPLHRGAVFQGTLASANGNVLTVNGAAFSPNAYQASSFVLIASGAKEGMWYNRRECTEHPDH